MKRLIALVLVLASLFALCACEAPAPAPAPAPSPTPAPELTPETHAVIEEPASEHNTPSVIEVQITSENFFDYFEYFDFPESRTYEHKDSDGNITYLSAPSGFLLRKGYMLAEEMQDECSVEIEVRFDEHRFAHNGGITVDMDALTYSVTGRPSYVESYDEICTGTINFSPDTYYIYIHCPTTLGNGKDHSTFIIIQDTIELVSASGTLYLVG